MIELRHCLPLNIKYWEKYVPNDFSSLTLNFGHRVYINPREVYAGKGDYPKVNLRRLVSYLWLHTPSQSVLLIPPRLALCHSLLFTCGFTFHGFSYLQSTTVQKLLNGRFQK